MNNWPSHCTIPSEAQPAAASLHCLLCALPPAGKLWSRSIKLAYNILHKLGSKQEPMVRPGDRVSLTLLLRPCYFHCLPEPTSGCNALSAHPPGGAGVPQQ